MIKKYLKIIFVGLLSNYTLLLTSCNKEEVIDPLYDVEVNILKTKNSFNFNSIDSVLLFFYKSDSLFKTQKVRIPRDKISLPSGEYNVLMLNDEIAGISTYDLNSYSKAKILLNEQTKNSFSISDEVLCYSKNKFIIGPMRINNLIIEPENVVKKLDYQIVIGGLKDSLNKCLITQPGISNGIYIHNREPIFLNDSGFSITVEALKENNYCGTINLLGINSESQSLYVEFHYNNKKTQSTIIDISNILDENFYHKRVIMYVDVSVVDLEMVAVLKSWITVDEEIVI